MVVLTPALEDGLVFEVLIIFLVGRRAFRLVNGVTYSEGRIMTSVVLYALLFAVTLLEVYLLLPWFTLVADVGIVAFGALVFVGHAERTVVFEQKRKGVWVYRLPVLVSLIYVVLWIARLGIDLVYFPQVLEFSAVTSVPSTDAVVALALVDGLFALSTGMLFGRSWGVIRAHAKLPKDAPVAAASPSLPDPNSPLP